MMPRLEENDDFVFAKDVFVSSFEVKEIQAAIKVGVPVKFAGAVLNAVIGFGVGVIQSFIIKKVKRKLKN